MPEKKEEKDFLIVPELPSAPMRTILGNDEKEYELMTYGEALKEILMKLEKIEKSV